MKKVPPAMLASAEALASGHCRISGSQSKPNDHRHSLHVVLMTSSVTCVHPQCRLLLYPVLLGYLWLLLPPHPQCTQRCFPAPLQLLRPADPGPNSTESARLEPAFPETWEEPQLPCIYQE
jgi:hypothetical protein